MDSAKDETSAAQEVAWRLIGPVSELSNRQCRLIYSSLGYETDICLFHVRGEFFAMDARCSHSGGPLCDGDIEEADGVLQVFCPWHDYDFNLRTGRSNTGLQQQVHEVKLEDGSVFVKHIYGKPVDTREGPGYVSAFAVISGITRYLVHVCGVEMS